jgi:hypothetical protein
MAVLSGEDACGVKPRRRPSFSFDVSATVFQAEIFAVLACAAV